MIPKTILVIEDDDGFWEINQFSLEAAGGWEVLTAASGREGLTIAAEDQPDAILLDVMMPEMDGIETFQQLQADLRTQKIPIIFLTAKARGAEQERLKEMDISGLITKPIKPQDLVDQIREILHWPD